MQKQKVEIEDEFVHVLLVCKQDDETTELTELVPLPLCVRRSDSSSRSVKLPVQVLTLIEEHKSQDQQDSTQKGMTGNDKANDNDNDTDSLEVDKERTIMDDRLAKAEVLIQDVEDALAGKTKFLADPYPMPLEQKLATAKTILSRLQDVMLKKIKEVKTKSKLQDVYATTTSTQSVPVPREIIIDDTFYHQTTK